MNLYRVEVELVFDLLCVAESQEEARQIAKDNFQDEIRDNTTDSDYSFWTPFRITKHQEIPSEWNDGTPYGETELSAAEWLDQNPPEPPKECAGQQHLFEDKELEVEE